MHMRVSYQSQRGLYQHSGDMSDYCMLSSQTFYGLLFSYLSITDVTSSVNHKFLVSVVPYI